MSPNPQCIRILHIGNNSDDANLIRSTLAKTNPQGFILEHTNNLSEALDILTRSKDRENNNDQVTNLEIKPEYSLILLDINLPDACGLDSVKRLQTRHPEQAIIVLSTLDEETYALQAVQVGAQDYLLKDDLKADTISRAIRYSLKRHNQDQQVARLANFDVLTGLPNRIRFNEYLEYAFQNWNHKGHALSILFINCDRFKLINDTHGHKIGDEFLQQMAHSIRNSLRSSDFVARLGGDEFVVVLDQENNNTGSPIIVAEKTLKRIEQGITLKNGLHVDASCSIGIATYNKQSSKPLSPEQLLNEANTAMSSAKNKGGNCIYFFDADLENQAERRTHLLKNVMGAYRQNEFSLYYQPIMNTESSECIGIEALMRWIKPNEEFISPDEFIPILEETGIIKTVGNWVTRQASVDFVRLRNNNLLPVDAWISVNVSAVQFGDQNFVFDIKSIIEETNINPQSLHLEITESLLVSQGNRSIQRMHELKNLGVKLSIDDFGTGYSSMKYLKDLPVNSLKIDKSFILQSLEFPEDNAITKAMISLAHNLNLCVVAEGVENAEVKEFLQEVSCDYLQGFHFCKPAPIDELETFLKEKLSLIK